MGSSTKNKSYLSTVAPQAAVAVPPAGQMRRVEELGGGPSSFLLELFLPLSGFAYPLEEPRTLNAFPTPRILTFGGPKKSAGRPIRKGLHETTRHSRPILRMCKQKYQYNMLSYDDQILPLFSCSGTTF